ncbi:CLUMA_CG011029, isoform A [Clunio marinus]|uniref:CLUMA_CG011029, isoform A n=1 Tax=Clunio marinus TaxID=568069 RepID=A0A1J1IDL8_9DIPT|nr:CLUMA_CG011029, isoform A [Clunio marinus]
MKYLCCFLSFCVMRLSNGQSHFHIPKYNNGIIQATVDIIEKFYMDRTNTLNFFYASLKQNETSSINNIDIINEILYQTREKVVVQIENSWKLKNSEISNCKLVKRVNNIFFIDSYNSFENIFRFITPDKFDYQGFYLIVITNYADEQYQVAKKIFNYLWKEFITNVNVIWMPDESENEAIVFTYFPFSQFFCGKVHPMKLNHYRDGNWLQNYSDFFPKKLYNLHNCTLTVAVASSPPFMILKDDTDGKLSIDGIDAKLLKELSNQMNFNINIVQVDTQGGVFKNGTAYGAAKLIINNDVNLTIGYTTCTSSENKHMSSSHVYYTSKLIWIVPPGRLFQSFEKLIKPFQRSLWLCVMLVLLISFISIIVVKCYPKRVQDFVFGKGITSPSLNMITVFFGGPLYKLPKRNFARTLLGCFMVYCLIIKSTYTGALFKFIRSDARDKDVSGVKAMIKQNFSFYVVDSSHDLVHEIPKILNRSIFIPRTMLSEIHVHLLQPEFKGALLSSEEHLSYLNMKSFPEKYYHHSKQIFYVFNLCIYLHRQSCFTEEINQHLLKFASNGLIDVWASQFIDKKCLTEKVSTLPTQLTNEKLLATYEILFVGFLMSFIIFIAEMSISKISKRLQTKL